MVLESRKLVDGQLSFNQSSESGPLSEIQMHISNVYLFICSAFIDLIYLNYFIL